ncbi:MAG: FKBP-type peptidyl-prolyl cis-trans isomerase [bacterium]|nr:FKBP-type peptidyl-prolyl cis-trans isomerase [bacterium]
MRAIIIFLVIAAAAIWAAAIYKPDLSALAPAEGSDQSGGEVEDPDQSVGGNTNQTNNMQELENGLKIEDIKEGQGEEAVSGKQITVHYVGTLENGTKFDSSRDRGTPFTFTLGAGQVIQGWDQGFAGMKIGGLRKLIIPSDLGYGDAGAPPAIPGGATLIFEVELLEVQ